MGDESFIDAILDELAEAHKKAREYSGTSVFEKLQNWGLTAQDLSGINLSGANLRGGILPKGKPTLGKF